MRILFLMGILVIASTLTVHALPNFEIPLTGTIVAETTGAPLEYATIAAYASDSTLIDGTVSNADGQFELQLAAGSYRIQIEFIGFTTQSLPVELSNALDMGTITLAPDQLTLEAVEVTAEKTQMNLLLDKKVFNVGQDIASRGGSANSVLEQLPSVSVTADGTVSLRGNSGVNILINGRPSALAANNVLDAIPAESIEKVEIITNPSARYEAAGTAGIINIILKKEQQYGYGGTVNIGTGYPAAHQANINMNVRKKKINTFLNLGSRYANFRAEAETLQNSTLPGLNSNFNRVEDEDRNDKVYYGYTGLDYNINSKNTLSSTYSLYRVINTDQSRTDYRYADENGAPTQTWNQVLDYTEPGTYQQLDVVYTKTFAREKEKLSLSFNNDFWAEEETEKTVIQESFPLSAALLNYRTSTLESSRDYLLQVDYEFPLGENGQLELGARGETRIISSDYLAEQRNIDNNWETLPGFANDLDYFERIGSAYLQYGLQQDKFGLQLGLRHEYTLVRVESVAETVNDVRKSYHRLFPSLSANYKISEETSTQFSYSRRIRRPSFWQLNPFRGINDPTQLFIGDPNLDPAYTDRIEFNFLQRWDKFTFNPAFYASATRDYFGFVIEQEPTNLFDFATGTILTRPINLDQEHQFGIELTTSYRPTEAWTIGGELLYYGYRQRGQFGDRNFDFDFATWSGGLRVQVDLPKDIRLQINGNYRAPRKDVQTTAGAQYHGSFGISKQWQKRLTLSANLQSPRWYRGEVFRPSFTQSSYQEWVGWRGSLNLQYRFEQGAGSERRRQRGSIR